MNCHSVLIRAIFSIALAFMLSACGPANQPAANLKFSAPERIVQVRAVNQSQLRPSVRLSNGVEIPMQRTNDNNWSGTINVQPNNTYFVSIEWLETLPAGDLVLAEWAQNVEVDADGTQVNLSSENYDYSANYDGDSFSNLLERQNDTDPFVFDEPVNSNDTTSNNTNDPTNSDDTNGDASVVDTSNNDTPAEPSDDNAGSNDNDNENTENSNGNDDDNTDNSSGNEDDNSIENDDDNSSGTSNENSNENSNGNGNGNSNVDIAVTIPRIPVSQAPIIDGKGVTLNSQNKLTGEWSAAAQTNDDGQRLWINRLMIDNNADAEDGAELRSWAAMHDGVYLYVLVLSDDIGARFADSDTPYQDDALELFIDADNSKLSQWGDADDFHYMIPLLKHNSKESNNQLNGRFNAGPGSSPVNLPIEFATGPGIGPDGIRISKWEQDVYELAIPLSAAGIQVGVPFGFELQLDDDDNGGDRNSKWGWFHPAREGGVDTDKTYLDPSIMGTVQLQD